MIEREDWTYGASIRDREYLTQDQTFAQLSTEISAAISNVQSTEIDVSIEPNNGVYDDRVLKALRCRRVSWRIQIDPILLDKLYNGRMGLRAEYYKSPYVGRTSNLQLIGAIRPYLLKAAEQKFDSDAGMIESSLGCQSAKIWIAEKDLNGRKIIRASELNLDSESIKNDWLNIAKAVKNGDYDDEFQLYASAINGVRAPVADRLEVKGGWLTTDGDEVVPDGKWDRDTQIFMFGFS